MPKNHRRLSQGPAPRPRPVLDPVDQALVEALMADGRLPNAALARRVGIAESTCLGRVKSLRERGVITGIHAHIDLAQIGRPVEAMVAVQFGGHARAQFEAFRAEVPHLPGVLSAIHVSGANDYLVHVAAASSDELRDFVLDQLTSRPGVVHAETSLVFEAMRGTKPI